MMHCQKNVKSRNIVYVNNIEILLIFLENLLDVWNKDQSAKEFVFPEMITLLNLDTYDKFPFFLDVFLTFTKRGY